MLEAAQKIVAISIRLKTDHVKIQQAFQYRVSPWQLFENIRRRKWDMQKEPGIGLLSKLPQITAHQHQVIIVHPNEIVTPGCLRDGSRKLAIYFLVHLPVIRIEVAPRRHIVK